jgi:O-antigen biosynthesis protein
MPVPTAVADDVSPEVNPLANASSTFSPVRTLDVEITAPLPRIEAIDSAAGVCFGSAIVLARCQGDPIGIARVSLPQDGLDPERLAEQLWDQLRSEIQTIDASVTGMDGHGLPQLDDLSSRERRASDLALLAPITAIVCTRGRPQRLRECLQALTMQDHPRFDVIVVDNAPTDDANAAVVAGMTGMLSIRRVVEPIAGLARARNTGVRAANTDLVAFLDDDELVDRRWLSELALGFAADERVGAVNGMILPVSLRTQSQWWFEEYGGHSKNRGFDTLIFDPSCPGDQHPLYPLPPFGAGGNMAFRREALIAIRGFDPALGAGTPARAAEDTAAFADLMILGYKVMYRPAAFVWHNHYQDFGDLCRQLAGYGSGLTTYFVRLVLRKPGLIGQVLSLLPRGVRDLTDRDSQRFASMTTQFPAELTRAHRRGMAWGLLAYPLAVWQQRSNPAGTLGGVS